ncbi:MAG: hypothetical protein SGILL_007188 [Bacillariaceae sp.]
MVRLAESVKETNNIENQATATATDKNENAALQHQKTSSPLETPCRLMRCLYYQPQPGAPVQLTRSKSMAAAYLTPPIMGTLMGIALLPTASYSEKEFRRILKERHGIKSNYVEDEWTGVSLARWKDIAMCLKPVAKDATSTTKEYNNVERLLATAVWSMAVWELTDSRQCLLDYLLAIHEVSGVDNIIFNDDNPYVQRGIMTNGDVQKEWASSMENDHDDDFEVASASTQSSLEELLYHVTAGQSPKTSDDTAKAIENLCESVLNRNQNKNVKPTTPNGYYGFDGGDIKPDCVEVAVRELFDYMLWDDQEGIFDLSILPSSAAPELYALYEAQSATENGQEWFDALSDIPGCLYLSSSPNERPYELTPTLRNVAKVCGRLLYNDGNLSKPVEEHDDWESLSTLQEEWGPQDLTLKFSTFSEKAKMSPDIIVHEVALVKRKGKTNAIEMRLRCDWARNTGFATVTHMRLKDEAIDGELLDRLLRLTMDGDENHPVHLLTLPLLADHGVQSDHSHENYSALLLSLLSSRHGVDRREMLHITATSDLEREELAYRKAYRESRKVLKCSILSVCDLATNKSTNTGGRLLELQLLNWILGEDPNMDQSTHLISQSHFDSEIEQALLQLPEELRFRESFRAQATRNWAIRGQLFGAILDCRSNKKTLIDSIRTLRFSDWPRFLLLNRFQK